MAKRDDYISDNLIHARERLKAYQQSLEVNITPENSTEHETEEEQTRAMPAEEPKFPPIGEKQFENYHNARRESLRKLNEFSILLEAKREIMANNCAEAAQLQNMFEQLSHELNELPNSLDELNNYPEKFEEYRQHNEQARLMLMRHSLAVKRLLENDPRAVANNISIVHEVASLTFYQLFRLGFGMFLPLIFSLIVAALAIGAAIIMTMGGI